MYQTGPTIEQTLYDIQSNKIVLPAIQREFVWQHSQICRLFDSLMQGYPFNTFLYWQVEPENSGKFQFYDFVLNYHERDDPHCPKLPTMPNKQLTAVLDGQQRLTALNIGLRGTMAWKLPRWRRNNPNAFPIRKLYLDLLWQPDGNDEEKLRYRFLFLTNDEIRRDEIRRAESNDQVCWFPVGEVLHMNNAGPAMTRWLLNKNVQQEQVELAHETLYELYEVVRSKPLIAYYEERSQELDKVLQIFIRTNSGGTILSYSDLLLSVAVAQWKPDAREEVYSLVDTLNKVGSGFLFSKDLVLKAGLLLSDIGNVGFKVNNFDQSNMTKFENRWDDIKNALSLTVQLVSDFGFNWQNLTATNAILPIAYYLYKRKPGEAYLTSSHFKADREAIHGWLIRSLLKGVWGGASDTLMTALRQVIRDKDGVDFPLEQMMRRGGVLVFGDEEIEDVADMQYGNRLTFALLSLLFPFVDLQNHQFHVDHVFPVSRFTQRRLRDAGVPDDKINDFIGNMNGLANLQLLQDTLNLEKRAKMPTEWLAETCPDDADRQAYQKLHLLGDVPESIIDFEDFYSERRKCLKAKIQQLLGRTTIP